MKESDGSPATSKALTVIKGMLKRGFILLPEGEYSNVISFTPPLTLTEFQIQKVVRDLEREIAEMEGA